MIRILIVDDIPLYRAGLRWVLERAGDCAIVGCATQVANILQLAQTQHPDVVLLHEGLAEGNALEIASLLLQQAEQRGLFVLASSGTEERVFQFFAFERGSAHNGHPKQVAPFLAFGLGRILGLHLASGISL